MDGYFAHMCVCAPLEYLMTGGPKKASDSLELNFQMVVSHIWVLGIVPVCSERAAILSVQLSVYNRRSILHGIYNRCLDIS